jgi:hypothetical protein
MTQYPCYSVFTSLSFDTLYEDIQSLLEKPVWSRPDKSEMVPLFES